MSARWSQVFYVWLVGISCITCFDDARYVHCFWPYQLRSLVRWHDYVYDISPWRFCSTGLALLNILTDATKCCVLSSNTIFAKPWPWSVVWSSVTRCWNKKLPKFSLKLLKSKHNSIYFPSYWHFSKYPNGSTYLGYFCMKFYYQELSKIVKSGRIGLWSNKATREIKKTIYCRFHFTAAKTITQSPGKFPFFFFSAALNCCFLPAIGNKSNSSSW